MRPSRWVLVTAATWVSLVGCSKTAQDGSCEAGSESCVCYANHTCNASLVCLSDHCVDVDGTGDAGAAERDRAADSADGAASDDSAVGHPGQKPSGKGPSAGSSGSNPENSASIDGSAPSEPRADNPQPDGEGPNTTQPDGPGRADDPVAPSDAPAGDDASATDAPTSDDPSSTEPPLFDPPDASAPSSTDETTSEPVPEPCSGPDCPILLCSPGETICSVDRLATCNAQGTDWVINDCPEGETCSGSSCKGQLCEPGSYSCDGTLLLSCSGDGTTLYTSQDCATADRLCLDGRCVDDCTPGEKLCTPSGIQVCGPTQQLQFQNACSKESYCDPETVSCKPKLCDPGPACDGNSATTCDELGAGFVGSATDCAARQCVAGECHDPLFLESFDDPASSWENYDGEDYLTSDTTDTPQGSGQAFGIAHLVSSGNQFDGPYRVLDAALKPTLISFWAKSIPGSVGTPTLSFSSSTGGTGDVFEFDFAAGDRMILSSPEAQAGDWQMPGSFVDDQWYFIELRNIDWETGTFDWFVDGKVIKRDGYFGSSDGIQRIDLYGGAYGTSFLAMMTLDELGFY
ncbi:MAG TPA: hypothetical protein VHM70_27260 [Polyangiaceae bacterium]|nr:hypothetical protein [Polyangiaceae bacterium]